MLWKKKIACCLLICLCCLSPGIAQYKLDQPVIISKDQGLPITGVISVAKGKDGFMWLGTAEGLCRFDGQQVKTFKLTDSRATAFFNNKINVVLCRDNEVWAGTDQGVSVFNTSNETFRHYQFNENGKADSVVRRFDQAVVVLYTDKQGDLWLGTREKGAWLYDKAKDNFKKFAYPDTAYKAIIPSLAPNSTTLSIEASGTNDSIVWIGTTAGLEEINKYSGKVKWYTYPQQNKDYQVALNAFRRLCYADNGLLYVGSWSAGVNVFDPVKKTFTPLAVKESAGKKVLNGVITRILRKGPEELWITTSIGLAVYNTREEEVTWYKINNSLKYEFYGVDYIDETNRIWFTNINGLMYFDPVVQQFTTYSFEHLFNKEWGYVFYIIPGPGIDQMTICPRVADGLYYFDKLKRDWTKSAFEGLSKMGVEHITVRGFAQLSPGRYLISADEGLFIYSTFSRTLTAVPNMAGINFKRWGDIVKDPSGNLWISADADGLIKWNPAKKQYRVFKQELTTGKTGAGFTRAVNLFADSRHNIWFARAGGFSVYQAATDSVINFIYSANQVNSFPFVNSFTDDGKGKVWMAAGDGWYGYADINKPEKGVIRKFDLRAQNINGVFEYMTSDKNGNVWSLTDKELVRINTTDMSVSTFSFAYGVKKVDFFHFSFLPSGEMVFGGRNSITIADPQELRRNKEQPVPYIDEVRLLDKPVDPSSYQDGGQLELNYRQNFITILFSAKAYTMPGGLLFRYRLKGFDDWVEVRDNRLAHYTNVPPGTYTFQLQAANNEGLWNKKIFELSFHIITPWWQTWWFRSAIVLLLAGLTYRLYQYRIEQVRKKEKLKTQYEKKLANVEMTALLAQMNPHFLFNSLNSIDSYIIRNESGKASEYLNNFARLIRLILQNSRSNYISLKDELETLDLYLQMESLRFKDKFQYEIVIGKEVDASAIVIPPMLIQPYVENAIWHGLMHKNDGTPKKVSITVCLENNSLVCVVEDNGIGREKARELKMQKTGNRKRSMAMQITSERIEMINKLYDTNTSVQVIDLYDNKNKPTGTRVKLVIPV